MPWLYSGPSDNLCQLRGVEEDHGESIHGGGEEEGAETGKFWDGSRDRWVSVVSTRVNPDAVFNPPPYSHAARGLLSTASSNADAELTPRTAILLWCVDLRRRVLLFCFGVYKGTCGLPQSSQSLNWLFDHGAMVCAGH